MKRSSWERHLPKWAVEYGQTPSGGWEQSLDDCCYGIEDREPSACAFGLALGIGFSLTVLDAWDWGGWKAWSLKTLLFVAGTWGCIGWVFKSEGMGDVKSAKKARKILAQLKARERKYSEEDVKKVELFRDWILELYRAEEREIKLCRFELWREWKIWRLNKGGHALQLSFYDDFLEEQRSHSWDV
ncbi:hypothetical protein N9942_01760 [Akkermansiaceae bacterium]|nr:hypothetical protein [Akkermansiaceae bacterium]